MFLSQPVLNTKTNDTFTTLDFLDTLQTLVGYLDCLFSGGFLRENAHIVNVEQRNSTTSSEHGGDMSKKRHGNGRD